MVEGSPWEASIVIPSWNDECRLASTLREYVPALEANLANFEIIVVSDGEKEPTRHVVAEYAERGVGLLEFPNKQGKGGAVIAGLKTARYSVVGYVDADGPVSGEDLIRLVQRVSDCDGVVATRALTNPGGTPTRSFQRRVLSRGWNLLVRIILGLQYSDTQCGAKVFRRSTLEPVLAEIGLNDWAFDVALLYRLKSERARILEMAVPGRPSTHSKLDIPAVMPLMLLSLAGVRLIGTRLGKRIPGGWISWFLDRSARS